MPSSGNDLRSHGFPFPLGPGQYHDLPTRAQSTMRSLCRLAGYKFESPRMQHSHRPRTAVQEHVSSRVLESIAEAGDRPEDMSGFSALQDMMRSNNLYEGEPGNLACYDPEKLKILRSSMRPRPLKQLLPPHVLPLLDRKETHIERGPREFSSFVRDHPGVCPKQPYWDPDLRKDDAVRIDFFRRLYRSGILSFRTRIRSKIGIFFVKKKDPGAIRMIIDARITNAHHKPPPVTRLGSSVNYGDLDLSEEGLRHLTDCGEGAVGWGTEMDVSDCFYQFEIRQMASWFGIDMPRKSSFWIEHGFKVESVYSEEYDSFHPVRADTVLYPVIGVMPMGWTWALFFANETVAHLVRQSNPDASCSLEMREKLPVPQLWEARSITSTYVDNVAIVGAQKDHVEARASKIAETFANHGIPIVWTYKEPVRCLETVGCTIDFQRKVLKNRPHRLWRVHLSGMELARRSKVRGETVRVWLGHATALMRLAPHLLSIFDKVYRFVNVSVGKRVPLWPAVRAEIVTASHLIWLCRVDLGASFIRQLDMGDSADKGYAMMTRTASPDSIRQACRVKERWRYLPMPESLKEIVAGADSVSGSSAIRDFATLETALEKVVPSWSVSGVGLGTEYGRWLQEALAEGSWLRTSPLMSQYRARRAKRDDVEIPALVAPLNSDLVEPSSFRLLWAKRWRYPDEHIGIKEARVALSSLKRTARVFSLCGLRKLTISDNLPVVLAFEKGRSSRPGLNRLCRIAGALQAGTGIRWRLRHIETKRNAADAPSRWFEKQLTQTELNIILQNQHKSHPRPLCLAERVSIQDPKDDHLRESDDGRGSLRATGCISTPTPSASDPFTSLVGPKSQVNQKVGSFWEIFAGSGQLTESVRHFFKSGLPPIDICLSSTHDLTRRSTQDVIKKVLVSKGAQYVHLGTPCTVFSRARHNITNHVRARERERVGCELAFFTCEVARLAHSRGIFWSIENPTSSRLWDFPSVQELCGIPGVFFVHFVMCSYGDACKRPTSVLTNCQALKGLESDCVHSRHLHCGAGGNRIESPCDQRANFYNRTARTGAYPPRLCDVWASLISPCLHHVSKITGADYGDIEGWLRQAAGSKASKQRFWWVDRANQKEGPKLLDSIAFGQHSNAEAEARRRRRKELRQRAKIQDRTCTCQNQGTQAGCAR